MRLRYDPPYWMGICKIGVDGPSGVRHFFRYSQGFICDVADKSDAEFILAMPGFSAVDPVLVEPVVINLQHLDRAGMNAIALRLGKKFHHKTSDAKVREELSALLAEEMTHADDAGSL